MCAFANSEVLEQADIEVARLIDAEVGLQAATLRLIPSENYVSSAVLAASGTVLQNRYSEGYPGKRYYEGQQVIDQIESLAIQRAKDLFGVEYANVQPYSGSPANLAVYLAFAKPGDKVLGMSLPMGGHLTHGWNVSATGIWFSGVQYGVNAATGRVDLDEVRDLALEYHPRILFCGGTAVPRVVDFAGFRQIADEVGAILVADIAHIAGLVAGGAHPSPVPYADVITTTTHKTLRGPRGAMILARSEYAKQINRAVFPGLQGGPHNNTTAAIAVALHEASVEAFKSYSATVVENAEALALALMNRGYDLVSGGTDNHLILVDLTNRGIDGRTAAHALDSAGLVTNYNTIPFDPRPPRRPSGVRLGTPAITSRGMGPDQMGMVADWFDRVVSSVTAGNNDGLVADIREEVRGYLKGYPAPGILT